MVKIARSSTLEQTIEVAALQETALGVLHKGWKQIHQPLHPKWIEIPRATPANYAHDESENSKPPIRLQKVPQSDLQLKRKLGLCFKCDEKYFAGHVCKNRALNLLIIDPVETEEEHAAGEADPDGIFDPAPLEVSLHALMGQTTNSTVRIFGQLGYQKNSILIDSGSTNSFIDERLAAHFRFPMEPGKTAGMVVANGEKLRSKELVEPVTWKMLDLPFSYPLQTLKFGGSDIILGIDWISAHSPVTFDPPRQTLLIHYEGSPLSIPYANLTNHCLQSTSAECELEKTAHWFYCLTATYGD